MFEAAPHPDSLKLAIAGLAIVAGLAFIAVNFRRRSLARRAASWPAVAGTITQSRTARRWGLGNGIWIAGLWYVPDIVYRYEVDGRTYTGRKITLADTGYPKLRAAREIIDRYPEGTAVSVFYDPAKPKRAFLEPQREERRTLGIAVLLLAIAGAALLAG
ncbi:hypothetical protein IZ6_24480 [Terrihabitans soli]|uniref:DUF3592 domain-containing protein n=1 Tax=Terrihabitans soli TaxID=708113 RepID=A0A6S6QK93_9HYPH|nr:DUF3592 domain-containing protein [Terrihabitans soli]BCJ91713.1 hypothetical protein IZ6_24480 [Terrihabitans soli]